MDIQASRTRRRAAVAVTLAAALSITAAPAASAATGRPAVRHPAGSQAVVHRVSRAGQGATRAYWSRARMAAATPLPAPQAQRAVMRTAAPAGIPKPTLFDGVPTVGALFFTTGRQSHFCTASVVNSLTANLILTAAHCVYDHSYASNIEFVPEYHDGKLPYGAWPVSSITVAARWRSAHNQNLDFAFLAVAPPSGTDVPIQFVTGGLWLGIDQGYDHPIEVIGYNDTQNAPIGCVTRSFRFETDQMKFYCAAFWDGTSGGPWITGFDRHTGTGTVIGDIGGYEQGGDYPWASYSPYFGWPTLKLFLQAESQQS